MSLVHHSVTLVVLQEPEIVAAEAAARIAAEIRAQPDAVLGLATGRTPLTVYARLGAMHRETGLSFRQVTSFNLDEYRGLGPSDPTSFAAYMQRELFGRVDICADRAHLPDGLMPPQQAAERYEAMIRAAGGIGLQLLGIGNNGHIAFNEPGSDFASRTREVTLSEATRNANAPDFPPGALLPETALTMGIGTILEARELLLLAIGARKADALANALDKPPSPDCPASALQLHPRVTVLCDRAAARRLGA
ncbi:glucosamine-6-phosphate deaminase (plasmid) [Paroceanicella profunda]|uniref:Glucosamine-6-phosphate deaminase n=1 Tax=Paroceanicella profunda TaxID=2579971 RepID=A0A5B8G685_9RHOB|nr:glucosamine-6-phosphate deaminase [Paroceanicella profunda]QDL94942.1 glucosamine-6-phosphate deaminase [Paroceanicella profunda]